MRAGDVAGQRYVRFPPHLRHVLVPTAPAGAAALGTTLYTASRPRPLVAQRALWALARVGGARLLPGPRTTWSPPVGPDVWDALWQQWTALLGEVHGLAVYTRPQASRSGVVLALWQPGRAAVVRLRRDAADLDRDARVAATAVTSFRVPAVLGRGGTGGWSWLAQEAFAVRPHRPVLALPDGLLDDVARTVSAVLTRPPGTPAHWQPAHGDLTPWNLRRAGGQTWLIDWEDAGWAPPHADEVYFAAVRAATGTGPPPPDLTGVRAEATAHWRDRVARRAHDDADADLSRRLLAVLQA